MINDIVNVRLHDNGAATMSYIVEDEENEDETTAKFMMIVTIFR